MADAHVGVLFVGVRNLKFEFAFHFFHESWVIETAIDRRLPLEQKKGHNFHQITPSAKLKTFHHDHIIH